MSEDLSRKMLLERWRTNMVTSHEPDPAFEKFLEEEGKEIDELLAALSRPKLEAST